jgi:hypothetical protein
MDKLETKSEAPEAELDDLTLTDEDAERVKGGAQPTNESVRPGGGLQHNETVLCAV